MGTNELTTHIHRKKWTEVIDRIASYPNEVHSWGNQGDLPLHRACYHEDIPVKVMEALINVYPESVKQKNKITGIIPLHCAVRHYSSTNSDVVKLLLQKHKRGALVKDENGRTPLIYHLLVCQSPSLDVIKILVEAHSDVVRVSDNRKWYPLHYAAYRGDLAISKYLIHWYPDALLEENNDNRTPRDITVCSCRPKLHDKLREEEERHFGRSSVASPPSNKAARQMDQHDYVVNCGRDKTSLKYAVSDDGSVDEQPVETLPSEFTMLSTSEDLDHDKKYMIHDQEETQSIVHNETDKTSLKAEGSYDDSSGALSAKTLTYECTMMTNSNDLYLDKTDILQEEQKLHSNVYNENDKTSRNTEGSDNDEPLTYECTMLPTSDNVDHKIRDIIQDQQDFQSNFHDETDKTSLKADGCDDESSSAPEETLPSESMISSTSEATDHVKTDVIQNQSQIKKHGYSYSKSMHARLMAYDI